VIVIRDYSTRSNVIPDHATVLGRVQPRTANSKPEQRHTHTHTRIYMFTRISTSLLPVWR